MGHNDIYHCCITSTWRHQVEIFRVTLISLQSERVRESESEREWERVRERESESEREWERVRERERQKYGQTDRNRFWISRTGMHNYYTVTKNWYLGRINALLSVCLPVYLPVRLSVSFSVPLCLSVYLLLFVSCRLVKVTPNISTWWRHMVVYQLWLISVCRHYPLDGSTDEFQLKSFILTQWTDCSSPWRHVIVLFLTII